MCLHDFKLLHKNLKVCVIKTNDFNPLSSDTDPTQDIPISRVEMAANGLPLNVKVHNMPMTGTKVEDFTSLEKRNTDTFDQLGEYRNLVSDVSRVSSTNYIKPNSKKSIKNEN